MHLDNIIRSRYTTKTYDPSRKLTEQQEQQLIDLLRFSPSSVNSQPWHFFTATTEEQKARLLPAIMEANASKVKDAAMVIVIATHTAITESHLNALLEQETKDGRYVNEDARAGQDKGRRYFVDLNSRSPEMQQAWMDRQAYIALGFLLLGAAGMGLDATPIEGFMPHKMDEVLDLNAKSLHSLVVVTVGFRSANDFNASLPKSRLDERQVVTRL